MNHYIFLFSALMLIILLLMALHESIFWTGVLGIFGVAVFANVLALINMRRRPAMVGLDEQSFFIMSVYDVVFKEEVETFPLPYANVKARGHTMTLTYHDKVMTLKAQEWPDWPHLVANLL